MEDNPELKKSIWIWLFNPFHFIAGSQSLAIGIVIILLSCLIGSFSNSHFDGVLDFHSGANVPLWFFIFEGLIDWLVMGFLLLIGGKLISKSRIRSVDVLGTQALARSPMIVTALVALLPAYRNFTVELAKAGQNIEEVISIIQAWGLIESITAFISATYGSF